MATNHYENTLPDLSTGADIPAILTAFAGSIGQYVPVASRTEANQRLTEKGVGTGPMLVFRTDINALESHPNTGAQGEGWTQQTNKTLTAADISTSQGGTVQSLLTTLLGGLSGLPAIAWGRTPVDVIGSRPNVFDTGAVAYSTGVNLPFGGTPAVMLLPYIGTDGTVVEASAPVVNTAGFTIRVKRNGYAAGQVIFPWIAIGPAA